MRDFTLQMYRELLNAAISSGYSLMAYEDFIDGIEGGAHAYILRHDVDDLPSRSVDTALLENSLGKRGTYYFRIVKQSNDPDAIRTIADAGHEIGYHYEDLTLCNGNMEQAWESFRKNLAWFRRFYPVKTICMHGSPMSRWDNRRLWDKYDYRGEGISGEPYFDIDFKKVLYITDTGRSWNGGNYSIRDKVDGLKADIRSTHDLILKLHQGSLPNQIMQNIHPQRWTDNTTGWIRELVMQNLKNTVKRIIAK
jgi:hypothetical protein